MKILNKITVIFSFLLLTILPISLQAKDLPTVRWRMQALWDAGTTPYKYEEKFVQRVSELTEGKFKITLFSGGQIVPASQAFEAVKAGAFQMMKTFDGYEAGSIPVFAFTSTVPFGFPEPEQYEQWFYQKGGLEIARQAYKKHGLYYIAPTIYGQEPLHSTFPIHTLEDIKNKKGRFVGLASSVMGDFGVITTSVSTAEVYQALEKGVIDFSDRGDLTANYEAGLGEVAKFIIIPGFHQPSTATSYVANQRAYQRLPEKYKQALEIAAKEISLSLREFIKNQDIVAIDNFKKQGVNVINFPDSEINKGRKAAINSWQKAAGSDPLAQQALKTQIDYMQELNLL